MGIEADGFPPPRTPCLAAGITALPAMTSSPYAYLRPLSLLAFKEPEVTVIAQPSYGTTRNIHTTVNRKWSGMLSLGVIVLRDTGRGPHYPGCTAHLVPARIPFTFTTWLRCVRTPQGKANGPKISVGGRVKVKAVAVFSVSISLGSSCVYGVPVPMPTGTIFNDLCSSAHNNCRTNPHEVLISVKEGWRMPIWRIANI